MQTIKDFKTATDGTGTTSSTKTIHFLRTMLFREDLQEFDALAVQVVSTTNRHIKLIKKCLLVYFPPINTLNK